MYCIIVKIKIKPDTRKAFLNALLANGEAAVRDEPDCHVFDVTEDRDGPDTFYIYEVYTSADALAVHKETPHYKACRAVINDLIAEQSIKHTDVIALNPTRLR